MKNAMIILFFLLLTSVYCFSQIRENKIEMSQGIQPGLSISLPDAKSGYVEKIWKNYTKSYGKLTKVKKTDELKLEAVVIPSIYGENLLDVYSLIEDNGITVFFGLKTGFIDASETPNEYEASKKFLQEFAYEVQRAQVSEELEKENEKLKKLAKKMTDLVTDHKDYHRDIEVAKEKIKKAEQNIINNEKEQDLTKVQITTQTKTVEMIQDKLGKIGKAN